MITSLNPDWAKIYNDFKAPICNFDCSTLCSPGEHESAVCCNNETHQPILFTSELEWHSSNTSCMWKRKQALTADDIRDEFELSDHIKYCHCDGPVNCDRNKRSLTCRFFPFDPYIDPHGRLSGIVYMYRFKADCPLIDNDAITINSLYIAQSLKTWRKIFSLFPDELGLYKAESEKLRKSFQKAGQKLQIFYV